MRLPTDIDSKESSSLEPRSGRDLKEYQEMIVCRICQGYMIDPTTVDYCYHTYCRSCILKHLLRDVFCPQCKGNSAKQINEGNLKSDDTLRALIFKLVPNLYQRECARLTEFEEQHEDLAEDDKEQQPPHPEFFTPAEPISLSLEYHPAMLRGCGIGELPPVCYLQCPAGLRIRHLKRFLCSKYDIDPEHRQIEVEVTYEDEVLPPDFTLMDVGYCYKWSRRAPMAFRYRILLYDSQTAKNDENNLSKVNQDIEPRPLSSMAATSSAGSGGSLDAKRGGRRDKSAAISSSHTKSVTFADDVELQSGKTRSKATATAKPSRDNGLAKSKKGKVEDSAYPLSNFKSLRSNDMRYSDYGVTSQAAPALLRVKSEPEEPREQLSTTNFVVSIPQSQLSKSAAGYALDEGVFELKTANKKNLPKLKIELASMKAKLTMPKSAEPRLEAVSGQQLDLETYAKKIGLKPIEPTTPTVVDLKNSPSASPMSSCSSSTTGSSNGGPFCLSNAIADASTCNSATSASTSSHRKRKKKHSRESKDSNGKRKKLHAEISSQTADGKMKMKITTTTHHNHHKAHKLELKRSHSIAGGELAPHVQLMKLEESENESMNALNKTLGEESRSISNLMTSAETSTAGASGTASGVASGAASGANSGPVAGAVTGAASGSIAGSIIKPQGVVRELTLPSSPPLPPSLFKAFIPTSTATTTQSAANSASSSPSSATSPSPITTPSPSPSPCSGAKSKPSSPQLLTRKPTPPPVPKPMTSAPHFAVPNPPARQAHHMQRYLSNSTPSSIASAANKQPKRSMSLDDPHPQLGKQPRLDYQPQQQHAAAAAAAAAAVLSKYAGKLQLPSKASGQLHPAYSHNPPMRLYGPELAKQSMQMMCPGSLSLTPPSINSGVTITPRPRATPSSLAAMHHSHGLAFPYVEAAAAAAAAAASLNNMPALEIVRINPGKKLSMPPLSPPSPNPRLMGPPAAKPALKRAAQSPPMPAMVKSPPLAVALSAQRAYRTSPPALINLRNTVPLALPAKQSPAVAAAVAAAKKSALAAAAAAAAASQSKANGMAALLDKSKTSLRDFRPAVASTSSTKDADILDLSAGRNAKPTVTAKLASSSSGKAATASSAPPALHTPPPAAGNSLEAALNKIKQNISANSNGGAATGSIASSSSGGGGGGGGSGDDLQNLHMLSESATAREKISIKANNIFENKPKSSLVRQQNASVRSIPNPSALAFRNQASSQLLTTATTTTTTTSASTLPATPAKPVSSPLAKEEKEKPKSSPTATLLSPTGSSGGGGGGGGSATPQATSPRATKKLTTIDQVAANLNIRAEAKAAALAEEAPAVSADSGSSEAKSEPELPKTSSAKTEAAATTKTTTPTTAPVKIKEASPAPLLPASLVTSVPEALPKPPVQIAATDTLAPVASSA